LTYLFEIMAKHYAEGSSALANQHFIGQTRKIYIEEKRQYLLQLHRFKDWLKIFDIFYNSLMTNQGEE
jgi:hypothetical protein